MEEIVGNDLKKEKVVSYVVGKPTISTKGITVPMRVYYLQKEEETEYVAIPNMNSIHIEIYCAGRSIDEAIYKAEVIVRELVKKEMYKRENSEEDVKNEKYYELRYMKEFEIEKGMINVV